MSVDIYINFNGNTREVVEFYAQAFGTDAPNFMTFGSMPPNPDYQLPDSAKDLIMHTRLNLLGSNVMFSDVFPGMPFVAGTNISLSVSSKNIDEIKALFDKLKEGGKVTMELQETFWSICYGSAKDKFGIEWLFNLDSGEMM